MEFHYEGRGQVRFLGMFGQESRQYHPCFLDIIYFPNKVSSLYLTSGLLEDECFDLLQRKSQCKHVFEPFEDYSEECFDHLFLNIEIAVQLLFHLNQTICSACFLYTVMV